MRKKLDLIRNDHEKNWIYKEIKMKNIWIYKKISMKNIRIYKEIRMKIKIRDPRVSI